MTTNTKTEPKDLTDLLMRATHHDLIRKQVVRRLGSPDGLLGVDVRPLWGKYYRVNVRAGAGFTTTRVTNSFFVTTDDDGNILESSPAIERRY